jgi:hypothetical protein
MEEKRFPVTHSDEEWRKLLTPEQYDILRGHGTERPGTCALNYEKRSGTFSCAGCGSVIRHAFGRRQYPSVVIPGRRVAAGPESIFPARGYGFRAPRFARPRNDSLESWRRLLIRRGEHTRSVLSARDRI